MKHSYHFNITEVVDGKIQEVMHFNFGGHHDLAKLAGVAAGKENLADKHAKELVVGMRLLHHVLKKYPDNEKFAAFLPLLNDFKKALKGKCDQE
ncbi:MAG: DUF3861 family protein [Muribaculaceae bacterium]|nr:DUF3861 family protein [Muribaculaceae bacterium]